MTPDVPDVLARIVDETRAEVARRRREMPENDLRREAAMRPPALDAVARLSAAAGPGRPAVIAEFKRASPSAGLIRDEPDPLPVVRGYVAHGATMLSILTEPRHFRGSLDDLRRVRAALPDVPLLRKDFIVDPYQVWEARAAGADAVLLIVACLDDRALHTLHEAILVQEMTPLVEVHTPDEAVRALRVPMLRVLGINNRDLKTLQVNLDTTRAIVEAIRSRPHRAVAGSSAPGVPFLVSESGLATPADVTRVAAAGAAAILVGEALMRQPDPGAALAALLA